MDQQVEERLQWLKEASGIYLRAAKKRKRIPDSTSPSSSSVGSPVTTWVNQSLRNADPDISELMEKEQNSALKGIALVASDNFVCKAAMEALGSHLSNNYILGNIRERNVSGNQNIDQIEKLCRQRALAAFGLDSENWGVIVQPSPANFVVFVGLLKPGDKIMGLQIGKLGFVQCKDNFFQSLSYTLNPETGYIDYAKLEEQALDFRPNLLICGGFAYPREWDYARFRQIADKCGAVLMCDMSQSSGLVAAKECASPFECCDIVTSTSQGGIIFCRKGLKWKNDFERKIEFGGPHNNHIVALAIALKQVASPEYKMYMQQVKKNAQAFASALLRRNCGLISRGTDNHVVLWDLSSFGLPGFYFEKVCEMCNITLSLDLTVDDNGDDTAGVVKIGTAAMTSRGCLERDFEFMAGILVRAANIASSSLKTSKELHEPFLKLLENNKKIIVLRALVEYFASLFAMPGR